jgi:4'-phosphopantetheinyl transferase
VSALAVLDVASRVDISECRLDTEADIALGEAYAMLNPEERARTARFVFTRDAERYVRGRGYLRRRLGAFLGMAPTEAPILVGEYGKPFVEGHLVEFNLSHSGSHAVLAITSQAHVGIDIETVDRLNLGDELDGLARMCLTDEERRALTDLPPERRERRFLSYWTAKEARMKLTGEGFALDPLDISLELSGGKAVGYSRPTEPSADLRFIRLSHPDAICCLAIEREGRPTPDVRLDVGDLCAHPRMEAIHGRRV